RLDRAATTSSISVWVGAPGAAGRSSSGEVRYQVRHLSGEVAVSCRRAGCAATVPPGPGERAPDASGKSAAPAKLEFNSRRRETRSDGQDAVDIVVLLSKAAQSADCGPAATLGSPAGDREG